MKRAKFERDAPPKSEATGGLVARKHSYHFSCGNSTVGPIGFCARVDATSKREALQILQSCMPQAIPIERELEFENDEDAARLEYFEVYLNPEAITIKNIDEVDG
jgi:hypothetical protein